DLPGNASDWLKDLGGEAQNLIQKGNQIGFGFQSGTRPQPNKDGRIATTLEWAKKLTAADVKVLRGEATFGDKVPDVDEGFTEADMKDAKKAEAIRRVIQQRLDRARKERPAGYLVREAPADDVKQLKILTGHLQEGQFLTKFRKTFIKNEMNDDLLIVEAKAGQADDRSEYEEILPTSPP